MIREILGFSCLWTHWPKKEETKLLKNATEGITLNGFFRFSIGYNSKFTPPGVNFATNLFFLELNYTKTQNFQTLTFLDQARIMMKNKKKIEFSSEVEVGLEPLPLEWFRIVCL